MWREERESGFTLIEILVVLAIMAMLMGGVAFGIKFATLEGEKTETRGIIGEIGACLEQVRDPNNLGEYPPTNTSELRIGRKALGKELAIPNESNLGIETVALVLFMKDLDVGSRISTNFLINVDGDEAGKNLTTHAKLDLFEIRDAWGQPLIYIHHRDYEAVTASPMESWCFHDMNVLVKPIVNPTTGTFYKLESYQLFSLGPDGEFDTDDDIRNF